MHTDLNNIILLFTAFLITAILLAIVVRLALLMSLRIFTNKHIESDKISAAIEKKRQEKLDEDLYRDKEKERSSKISKSDEIENKIDEVEIVDIVKPVGFWTSMILGQKLTYLVSSAKLMNQNRKKGFWASMVEAQGRAQGREKGRGR
jgi:hypothetical protein|tara:strand:- start:3053 stop:3496 length:444 start_codon:yes stop_codon:yes gene_type:complete